MCVRGNRASLVVYPLPEEYSLMLKLRRRSFFPPWRPVATALEKISKEAGFAMESGGHGGSWERTEVRTAIGTTIPLEIWRRGGWRAIEVMGRCREQDLGHKEQGFRIRTADAEELLLIREPLGIWYAET